MQEKSSLEFAGRLKIALVERGLRASALAEKAGISKGYVSELLKGKKAEPSFDACKKFAEVLGCSPSWLLFGCEEDQQDSTMLRDDIAVYGKKTAPLEQPEPTLAEVFELLRLAIDKLEIIVKKGRP